MFLILLTIMCLLFRLFELAMVLRESEQIVETDEILKVFATRVTFVKSEKMGGIYRKYVENFERESNYKILIDYKW